MESSSTNAVRTQTLNQGTQPKYFKIRDAGDRKVGALKTLKEVLLKTKTFNEEFEENRRALDNLMCGDLNAICGSPGKRCQNSDVMGSTEKSLYKEVNVRDSPLRKHMRKTFNALELRAVMNLKTTLMQKSQSYSNFANRQTADSCRYSRFSMVSSSLVNLHSVRSRKKIDLSVSDFNVFTDKSEGGSNTARKKNSITSNLYRRESVYGVSSEKESDVIERSSITTEMFCKNGSERESSGNTSDSADSSWSVRTNNQSKEIHGTEQQMQSVMNDSCRSNDDIAQTSLNQTVWDLQNSCIDNAQVGNQADFDELQLNTHYCLCGVVCNNTGSFPNQTTCNHDRTVFFEETQRNHVNHLEANYCRNCNCDIGNVMADFSNEYNIDDFQPTFTNCNNIYCGSPSDETLSDQLYDHRLCLTCQNRQFHFQLWQEFQNQLRFQSMQWQHFQYQLWQQLRYLQWQQAQKEQNEENNSQAKKQKQYNPKSILNNVEPLSMIMEEEEAAEDTT